ncbi:Hemagluttinin domain protein [Veillonella parvula DSM 2008]|uniref:ESPR-type extended signal peptide-containing protein n=2 Tax=Veillonella parvula TaxID=29466 RepID=UPI00019C0216|nr:ESPR-type extended signal peptide-containing protein [Veillonella parvula]ACZ23740.1 Hemagluttinin domain protein [Veillonella parvula DSM 2008]QQB16973.1 YadA-like family protein [Veillonella parvula]SNU93608.1 Haemagglutinin [Veillonella parvula]
MNRVFKVIWNRTKGCYVVVAETAKNMTKRSSLSVVFSKMVGATAVAVMLTGVMMPTDALGASITRGNGAQAENDGGIAIGDNTASKGDYSISIGTNASVGRGDTDEGKTQSGIAIGQGATVTVDVNKGKDVPANQRTGGIAIGQGATTKVVNAIAVGSGTSADGAQAVTIGHNSRSTTNNSVALGNETRVASTNGFALGNNARAGYDENNQLIGLDNDQAFGSNARAYGGSSMAFGNNAKASKGGAIAMGNGSQSRGDWAVAIGNGAKAMAQGARAIGANSTADATNAVAMGWTSTASGESSIAIGESTTATTAHSIAMSTGANVASEDAIAIGRNAQVDANQQRSIALGANSKTANVVSTPNQLVNGLWYKNYAGGSADSTLSVGSDTLKRTITNVAAGRVNAQSTDAINGSQLYGVANTLGNLASTTKGLLGGNAALDPDTGNLSMSNIGNTGKGTIHDAIKFNKDTIDKGLNFDANTGGAKNNLLGSKVTIKGDGSNINAAITQANGDTTINMTLGNTVTIGAANPVTINGTTGHVTGLQNKDWNVDNPVAVSGRAATEDQLKKVNDKVNTNKDQIDKNKQAIADNKQNITNNANNIAQNKQDISNINTKINKGLNFAGDTGTVSNRQLGDTVTVKGGATGTLSDGNIGVESDGNGTLNVKLAKTLTGLDSVTAGNTKIDNGGLTVGGKTYVSPSGLNANNQKITNVANGSDPNDAVNYSQLQAAIGGTAKASTVKAKDANVTVTESTNAAGGKEYTVGLGNKITVGTAHPVTVDGDAGHVTGLTNTDWNVDNPVAVSGRGATEDQLKKVNDKVNTNKTAIDKGLNFDGDSGAVINKKLGEKLSVKGGATGTLSDGNIGVESDGNGTLNVKLAKTLSGLDSVTAGGTTINNSGLTVGGKTYVSPTGINANDQKVTNVANGDVSANSKDAVNGGQLHDAKNELINKGLRFDADNNSEKTNKLGSKVTVNGDDNITTEITQTGDDTKIGVKLNKNLNVQTLTATDTVKAGGVTMGKHADTKNYVTGLDNKDWDVNTSNPVSGRAATEDQLKKISDVVKSQGAAATDYRLVKNAAAADEAYTVDSNGDIDLTVEDKNHAGSKETVKIKDVASKSSLDKLTDRAVKYDLDPAGTVDKTKVSYEGPTYANKVGGTHVTNLAYATGNDGSEAVNVDYLKDRIKDSEDALTNKGLKFDANSGGVKTNKLGSTVTVKGEGADADVNYSGENIKTFITQDQDGNTTIDVKMNKNLKANSVAIAGKNGQDGVTIKGGDAKNGVDGTSINRLVTEDKDGNTHTLATLDDGMMYGGDTGNVIKKKLNNQVNVKGGISDESKLATEDNIGVVSDGSDTLKLRLAKELKGLTSATFTNGGNNTVINGDGMTINRAGGNAVSLTKDGLDNGGNKITNVADGTDPNDAVNKSQLDKATAAASTTVSAGNNITVTPSTNANGSKNYEVSLKDQVTLGSDATKQIAMDGTTGTIKAGDKVTIDGNKGTIKAGNVTIDGENGTIKAGDKVTIDGKDGKIAAGKVSVDGKDGYVTGLENKDWDPNNITSGRAATEDQLQKSHKALDNKITNLGDEITKKGMNFAGNTGEFHRDLGQKVTIKGEGTESDDKYSGENIKTVADQDGNVTIKMAKNLKTDSLTTDKVKVGKNGQDGVSITGPNGADGTDGKVGITGKDGKDAVSMSGKDGVGHIGLTGKDGRNADITVDKGDPDLDGNNITRIKYQDENGKTHQVATKDDGMKYGGDSGSVIKKKLNEQVNVVGGITDASKLTTEDNLGVVSDGTGNLKVRMAKDLKGLETVTTKDAAGNTTVMNGGGVTITSASGNAVSLTKDGLNNGGNTITNVGPGVNGTDAVNVNQLKGATDGLANAINSVAGETQRVGAHAAAMSALKPIQYDPLEPTQVMAGIGNYRGETAAALGVAHYTAEDTMFHVGVSVGSHHNMVNAGVTRKFGTSDAKKAVPERYKGGPISSMYVMQDEMTALKAKYEKVQRDNEEMRAQIALLMQQAGLK